LWGAYSAPQISCLADRGLPPLSKNPALHSAPGTPQFNFLQKNIPALEIVFADSSSRREGGEENEEIPSPPESAVWEKAS